MEVRTDHEAAYPVLTDALLDAWEQAAEAGLEAERAWSSLPVLALVREVLGLRAELAAAGLQGSEVDVEEEQRRLRSLRRNLRRGLGLDL